MMNAGLGALMPGQSDQSFNFPAKQPMTPGDIVKSLSNLSVPELVQIGKSQPTGVPLWAVITAISEAQKKAQINAANQRQTAMQQGAQLAQSPTVAQEVLNSANYADDTVYAANGGEMRVQRFQSGGAPRAEMLFSVDGVPIYKPREGPERGESREEYEARKKREAEEADEVANRPLRRAARSAYDFLRSLSEGPRQFSERVAQDEALRSRAITAAQPTQEPTRTTAQTDVQTRPAVVPVDTAVPGPDASPKTAAKTVDRVVERRPTGSGAAIDMPPADRTGIAAFSPQSELAKRLQEIREGAEAERGALREQKDVPQSVLDARKRIDEILALTGTQYETERRRMAKSAEEAKRRAQERAALNPFADPATLGRMVAASSGKKTLGETLAAMAGAAGESQQERDKALRDAEDRYDLRQSELFKMDQLRTQINLESAKLVEARADGDFKRAKDIEEKLQKLKREAAIQQSNILIQMMDAQVKGEANQAQRESIKFARESQALQTAQLRVAQAEESVIKTLQKEFGAQFTMLNMDEKEFAKSYPDVYAKIRRREADLRKTVIDPAVKERDRLQLIATGLPPGVTVTEKK
jgi:hypothetical protein